ncbi:hypothetical protein V2J09_012843 [Rumex salicifolius]
MASTSSSGIFSVGVVVQAAKFENCSWFSRAHQSPTDPMIAYLSISRRLGWWLLPLTSVESSIHSSNLARFLSLAHRHHREVHVVVNDKTTRIEWDKMVGRSSRGQSYQLFKHHQFKSLLLLKAGS